MYAEAHIITHIRHLATEVVQAQHRVRHLLAVRNTAATTRAMAVRDSLEDQYVTALVSFGVDSAEARRAIDYELAAS